MMITVKRILVPTDFSETSDAALKYAFGLAQTFSAQLHLLHVQRKTDENFDPNVPFDRFEELAWERLETLVSQQEAKQLGPECSIRIGAPADEIVRYADDRDIDLIVMGTHGRSGVAHMLLGSVAEKVVRGARCPVLTIRHPRRAFVKPEEATAHDGDPRQTHGLA
jgi:nucleotide-binding universal stress UspA family protein